MILGIGANDYKESMSMNGKNILSYNIWKSMLYRCYSPKVHNRSPTYIGCTTCDEWLSFSNFKKWFDENYIEGFQLDKDILVEGNKVYSPDTCRFVPQHINSLLTDSSKSRGKLPLGVSVQKIIGRRKNLSYIAQVGSKNKLTKNFKTIEEASAWYSATKHQVVKERAIEAFLAGEILSDVASALINRKF